MANKKSVIDEFNRDLKTLADEIARFREDIRRLVQPWPGLLAQEKILYSKPPDPDKSTKNGDNLDPSLIEGED